MLVLLTAATLCHVGVADYLHCSTTVLEVSCFEGGDEEGGDTWYAEVRERGARKDKTYRIDRMQLLPVNPADLIEDA